MKSPSVSLPHPHQRQAVLDAIVEVCRFRRWPLLALHVRTSHLHGVVDCPDPRAAVRDWKSYSSRALNTNRKQWSRGGSTNTLRTSEAVRSAIHYVLEKQGTAMERYTPSFPRHPAIDQPRP